jgi:hypothetical protein
MACEEHLRSTRVRDIAASRDMPVQTLGEKANCAGLIMP